MQPSPDLPAVFAQYRAAGGVLGFALFDHSDGSQGDALAAIRAAIPPEFPLDEARLLDLGFRELDLAAFLGDWCDAASGRLIRKGKWYARDGREFDDPELVSLQGVAGDGGVCFPPDAGSGGQFAYGFLCPPGGDLRADPLAVQAMFDAVCAQVVPSGAVATIHDWSSPDLREACDYFAAGHDEWGIFLFTIHQPQTGRLTAIAGAAAF